MSQGRAYSAPINAAGSPLTGEPAFLAVGKLRHAHGVHGEILMEVLTDFPERPTPGTALYLGSEGDQLRLTKSRPHQAGLLMTFEGFSTPEQVSQLRNQIVYVKADDRPPLADGEYYHHQLIGLSVIDESGTSLGQIIEIIETGANDVYVVRSEDSHEILLPVLPEVILNVDLTTGSMQVRPPEWL